MKTKNIIQLVFAIILCEAVGVAAGFLFTMSEVESTWFVNLVKPEFYPPNWLFGPVWTILYAMMGGALYLIWQKKNMIYYSFANVFFYMQLVINFLWSFLFFRMHDLFLSVLAIVGLWILILLTMVFSSSLNRRTVYLLLPYLLWVSFATFLNYSIWQLNN